MNHEGVSLQFDWSTLGSESPAALVDARILAHHAIQWVTRAARANLEARPDDGHTCLEWNVAEGALLSQALPAQGGGVRVALRLADLHLLIFRGAAVSDRFGLDAGTDSAAGSWIDARLREAGLKPASSVALPYAVPHHSVASGACYDAKDKSGALQELSRWYGAAAEVLEAVRARNSNLRPGPSPVRCWPHHFDIATLVLLGSGNPESARSIGVGLSPGDESYPQPYVYVSPWPRFDGAGLPDLPPPGHWHTRGFFGAVATAEEILSLAERGPGVTAFIDKAFEIGRARLGS